MIAPVGFTTSTAVEAAICRKSFYEFVQRFWHIVIAEEPVWNWHIRYLCDEAQIVCERIFAGQDKEYDLVINVPPGSTKSTIFSIMLPAWCWTRMKSMRIIGGSHTDQLAMDLSRKGRIIVKSPKYQELFDVQLKPDQDVKSYYETMEGGDRHAVGVEANVTGFHAHLLIVDDPIDPEGVRSEPKIIGANRWINETLSGRKTNRNVTVMITIMQRLHQDDPSGMQLEQARTDSSIKIKHICLPAEDSDFVKPARMRLKYRRDPISGRKLLDPIRISWKAMLQAKKKLGEFGYAGQMDQNPVPLEGGMFKVTEIKIAIPPARKDFKRLVRYWDKAATEDGGAYTAGVLMGEDNFGRFWIMDVVRGQWDSGRRERQIRQTAEQDGRYEVLIGIEQEPGSGGKESAQATITKTLVGYRVVKDRVTGNKIQRADPFSVQVNNGNVYAKQGAVWWDEFRGEIQFFPFSKYKDQTDAASGAFAVLTQRVKVGAFGKPRTGVGFARR